MSSNYIRSETWTSLREPRAVGGGAQLEPPSSSSRAEAPMGGAARAHLLGEEFAHALQVRGRLQLQAPQLRCVLRLQLLDMLGAAARREAA